ncbi:MAG: hypothetical protein ACP5O8_01350 [Candidatus Aenigmatarchaeota archaeon]
MGLFSPFVYTAKNGKKFWLHVREKGKQKLYYFSKDPTGALRDLPKGYEVVENPVTGMPFLKRKEAKGFLSGLKPKKEEKQEQQA